MVRAADAADATAGEAQLFIVYLDGPGGDGVWDLGSDYLRISTGARHSIIESQCVAALHRLGLIQ